MIQAIIAASDEIEVQFRTFVNPGSFDLTDFTTTPGGFNPITITAASSTALTLTFGVSIAAQTFLTYNGNAPNQINPQTIDIQP